MEGLNKKIRRIFSDILLEIELFFSSFKKNTVSPESGAILPKAKIKNTERMPFSLRFLRISTNERLFLYDQLETLIGSGVTLIDALTIIQSQSNKKSVKRLYGEIIRHINGGMSLAETMYMLPNIFPDMQASLIEAGEKSGNLKNVLTRIVEELENHEDFIRKIKGAMFYPVVLIILALAMVIGMMIFVIPKVANLYKQSGTQLPFLTQKIIDISNYISENYIILFGGTFGIIFLLWLLASKTKIGRFLWEEFVWTIPVFGKINKQKNLMIFASNLGMLLQSGVLISDAFEITEKTMGNVHYKKALSKIRHGILLGKNISEMMGLEDIKSQKFIKNRLFPLQVAQMIHIGEITGTIAKMLIKIQQNYHKNINYALKNISTIIEPLMIFIVATLIGSILLAVMMPFFYMGSTIS